MLVSKTEFEVRFYETDLMGIVHHSNYIRYFECGRNQLLIDYGIPISEFDKVGIMLPVISVKCNYKVPAKMGDVLTIVTKIETLPLVKIVAKGEIYNQEGILLCSGEVVVGFIHESSRKATRAPQILIDKIKNHFKL